MSFKGNSDKLFVLETTKEHLEGLMFILPGHHVDYILCIMNVR